MMEVSISLIKNSNRMNLQKVRKERRSADQVALHISGSVLDYFKLNFNVTAGGIGVWAYFVRLGYHGLFIGIDVT